MKVKWSAPSIPPHLLSQVTGHLPFPPSRLRDDDALRSYKLAVTSSRDITSTRPENTDRTGHGGAFPPCGFFFETHSTLSFFKQGWRIKLKAASALVKLSTLLNYRPTPGVSFSLSQGSESVDTPWKDKVGGERHGSEDQRHKTVK